MQNFADEAKPLTILNSKDREFTWSPEQLKAFQSMKHTLCATPVLTTDASKTAIAAIMYKMEWKDLVHMPVGN